MKEADSEEISERVAKARERAVRERKGRLEAALRVLKPMQAAQCDPEARIMQQLGGGDCSQLQGADFDGCQGRGDYGVGGRPSGQ